ncbi:MAG: hypothetical protein Q8N99_01755 [Nanoarchaeota archaeon]|nr:hypothetical protein [Nanoarchaeota archaeon]
MTTIEEHTEIIKECMDDINEKIKSNLVYERQKIIGFASSESATNLFAVFLHSKNLIEPSFSVNHRFFFSIKIAEKKFDIDFSNKDKILDLLVKQEDFRNKLCYGKRKNIETVNSAIKNLFELKNLLENNKEGENE